MCWALFFQWRQGVQSTRLARLIFEHRHSSIILLPPCAVIYKKIRHKLFRKYNGDKLDPFHEQLPQSLLNNIHGNAVYNVTYPFLNLLTQQLEDEADSNYNTVPYDYRILQIPVEGSLWNYR